MIFVRQKIGVGWKCLWFVSMICLEFCEFWFWMHVVFKVSVLTRRLLYPKGKVRSNQREHTLQGTNISPKNGILKMIFLFPRWDMLIPWRVSHGVGVFLCFALRTITGVRPNKPSSLPLKKDLGYASKRMVIFQQRTPDCTPCVNIGKPSSSFFQPFMCQQLSCSLERVQFYCLEN